MNTQIPTKPARTLSFNKQTLGGLGLAGVKAPQMQTNPTDMTACPPSVYAPNCPPPPPPGGPYATNEFNTCYCS